MPPVTTALILINVAVFVLQTAYNDMLGFDLRALAF
jgi:hypothetical protein